jgi:hypothetical protein
VRCVESITVGLVLHLILLYRVRFVEHSLREVIFLPGTKEVAENRECYYSSLELYLVLDLLCFRYMLGAVGLRVVSFGACSAPNLDFKA